MKPYLNIIHCGGCEAEVNVKYPSSWADFIDVSCFLWIFPPGPWPLDFQISFSHSVYICPTWLCVPHQHFSTNSSLAWLLLSQLPCPTACNYHSLCNNSVANGFTCSMGLAWYCTEWLWKVFSDSVVATLLYIYIFKCTAELYCETVR